MHAARLFIANAVLAALFLAGCTGGGNDAKDVPDDVEFDARTGSIQGQVFDESELPVEGAGVSLTDLPMTATTDAEGRFVLNFVPPGTHELVVHKEGLEHAVKEVTVVAGQSTELVFVTLGAVPSDAPYTFIDQRRYSLSGAMVHLGPGDGASECTVVQNPIKTCNGSRSCSGSDDTCCVVYDEDKIPPPWQTIQGEAHWKAQSGVSGRSVEFEVNAPNTPAGSPPCGSIDQSSKYTWFTVQNDSPIVLRWDKPDALEERGVAEEDWCCGWFFRLWPGWCDLGTCDANPGPDVGTMQDLTVEVYFSAWIHAQAPEGWIAGPVDE